MYGVPQASILGSLLFFLFFLLYINDLPRAFVSDLLLYVDDNCLVFQHNNETEIEKQLLKIVHVCATGLLIKN